MPKTGLAVSHIDPREERIKSKEEIEELRELAGNLRAIGSNPDVYILRAVRALAKRQVAPAMKWIEYGEDLKNIFYAPNSDAALLFGEILNLMRPIVLLLGERFENLPPDRD